MVVFETWQVLVGKKIDKIIIEQNLQCPQGAAKMLGMIQKYRYR